MWYRKAEIEEEMKKPDVRLREELHAETLSNTTVEDAAERVRPGTPFKPLRERVRTIHISYVSFATFSPQTTYPIVHPPI
jgi:hypothetical protein